MRSEEKPVHRVSVRGTQRGVAFLRERGMRVVTAVGRERCTSTSPRARRSRERRSRSESRRRRKWEDKRRRKGRGKWADEEDGRAAADKSYACISFDFRSLYTKLKFAPALTNTNEYGAERGTGDN